GASDSFSGITANPLIGTVADRIIWGGGAAIMSEIPEMLGTFDMLFSRFRSFEIAEKFSVAVMWYLLLADKLGVNISDNVVPKNIEGGLINGYLKSLGAVLKGGATPIEDVVGYGEPAAPVGLSIMQGPGGDLESVTGLVSSGANLICFSTGYGAITGSAICPVIKISSTTDTYNALPDDIDFDAGRLLAENSLECLANELLAYCIRIASGEKTATERMKQRQFQIWTAGKLSL
ncbi:MAG: altronate dehydratase, partial [Pseudomonadota bacterium]